MIRLSKEACTKAISYSNDASKKLRGNNMIMDSKVNSSISGIQDPSLTKYFELYDKAKQNVEHICMGMDDISQYCKKLIAAINRYKES